MPDKKLTAAEIENKLDKMYTKLSTEEDCTIDVLELRTLLIDTIGHISYMKGRIMGMEAVIDRLLESKIKTLTDFEKRFIKKARIKKGLRQRYWFIGMNDFENLLKELGVDSND